MVLSCTFGSGDTVLSLWVALVPRFSLSRRLAGGGSLRVVGSLDMVPSFFLAQLPRFALQSRLYCNGSLRLDGSLNTVLSPSAAPWYRFSLSPRLTLDGSLSNARLQFWGSLCHQGFPHSVLSCIEGSFITVRSFFDGSSIGVRSLSTAHLYWFSPYRWLTFCGSLPGYGSRASVRSWS
jgi:hypothetical protein